MSDDVAATVPLGFRIPSEELKPGTPKSVTPATAVLEYLVRN